MSEDDAIEKLVIARRAVREARIVLDGYGWESIVEALDPIEAALDKQIKECIDYAAPDRPQSQGSGVRPCG